MPKTVILDNDTQAIARKLISKVGTTGYIGLNEMDDTHHKTFSVKLIQITRKCKEVGLPILSVKVVTKDALSVSNDLFNWYKLEYPNGQKTKEGMYKDELIKVDSVEKDKWEALFKVK